MGSGEAEVFELRDAKLLEVPGVRFLKVHPTKAVVAVNLISAIVPATNGANIPFRLGADKRKTSLEALDGLTVKSLVVLKIGLIIESNVAAEKLINDLNG